MIPNGPSVTKRSSQPSCRNVRVAERLALPSSDHGVAGSNPAGGEILPEPKRCFIAQSLSCSPVPRLEMTEILLKGRKTLTHPSINQVAVHNLDMHMCFQTQVLKLVQRYNENYLSHRGNYVKHLTLKATVAQPVHYCP